MQFKIGNRVITNANTCEDYDGELPIGIKGVVVDLNGYMIGVKWDINLLRLLGYGHDCRGRCENGYGWYVHSDKIEKEQLCNSKKATE